MRMRLFVVSVVVCLASSAFQAQQQLQVFASIVDGSGATPASLEPGDLRVIEGGTNLKVLKVEPVNDWPTKVQILLDNGVGLGNENLIHMRNGLRGLIEAIPDGVEVSIFSTAPQPRTLVRATTEKAAMLKGVDLLTPDGGAGRFVESLGEALQRIERDKVSHFPIIVAIASSAGDRNVMDRDIERIYKRLQDKPATVHVVIINRPQASGGPGAGALQGELGMSVTKATGGRFESIAAPSRIATLMPELGAQVAASYKKQSKQFRVTAERANASSPIAGVSMGTNNGMTVAGLSFDGRHP
jgi:hypothetical protein